MPTRTQKQLMLALAQQGTATWAKLLDAQDASLPEFYETLAASQEQGLLTIDRSLVSLTEAGRAAMASYLHAAPLALHCPTCETKGYWVEEQDARLQRLEQLLAGRPAPNFDYDQGAITVADLLVRTAFLEERGDLHGSAILLIGDDDLMSIALAMTTHPARIVVLEIDERIINFVQATARGEGFPIEAYPFDVRHPIPKHLQQQFDVFLCDPVETLPGMRLYLSRGCQGLRGTGAAAYLGLTTLEASRRKWFDIQGVLHEMGFVLTDIRRKFSSYPDHDEAPQDTTYSYPILEQMGDEQIGHRWYTSAFLRAEAVGVPTVPITGSVALGPEFYVDDEAWATPRKTNQEEPASQLNQELVQALLRNSFPDRSFPSAHVKYQAAGEDFVIFEVDGWAFRFPTRAEVAAGLLPERRLLDRLRPLGSLPVPQFTLWGEPSELFPFPFVGYRLLPGIEGVKAKNINWPQTASRLGRFLSELHSMAVDEVCSLGIPVRPERFAPREYLKLVRNTLPRPLPGLSAALSDACETFLEEQVVFDPPQVLRLIHGDLGAEHLLFDPALGELQGVIDWTDACISDPAFDFGALWAWGGESFLAELLANYTGPLDAEFVRRSHFLGRCLALDDYHDSLALGEAQIKFATDQLERAFLH